MAHAPPTGSTVLATPLSAWSDRVGRFRLLVGGYVAYGLFYLALGLIGTEDNPANLMYGAVLGICGFGAPVAVSGAMLAAALTAVEERTGSI